MGIKTNSSTVIAMNLALGEKSTILTHPIFQAFISAR